MHAPHATGLAFAKRRDALLRNGPRAIRIRRGSILLGTIEISDSMSEGRQVVDDPTPPRDGAAESSTVLPDLLTPGLRVVFCGIAVGTPSARRGAYAGSGNQFWSVLARVGLTPRQLAPAEFRASFHESLRRLQGPLPWVASRS